MRKIREKTMDYESGINTDSFHWLIKRNADGEQLVNQEV